MSDYLSSRWTKEQTKRAHAIVNDIAENIDNKETRAELRQALAIYADFVCDERETKQMASSTKTIEEMNALLIKLIGKDRLSDLKAGMTIAMKILDKNFSAYTFPDPRAAAYNYVLGSLILKRDSLTKKDLP